MAGERGRWWSSWWLIGVFVAISVTFGVLRLRKHAASTGPTPAPSASSVLENRYAASMITIAHKDVEEYAGLGPKPTRSKPEARELALKLIEEARRDPTRFAELARAHSDDPISIDGGALPDWKKGEYATTEAIIEKLQFGQISDLSETEFGFRVFRRDRPLPIATLCARQLIVAWKGAPRAATTVTRTKEEALVRAKELAAKARSNPAGFEALVRAESDGWDRDTGGYMGVWLTSSKRYPLIFNRELFAVEVQGAPPPVESLFGFHVLLRVEPTSPPPLAGAHILIAYRGAKRAPTAVQRSKEEARAIAEALTTKLKAAPLEFGVAARESSDDVTAADGGDLGSWKKGEKLPVIDDAFAAMRPGEIAGPIETPFGFHVIERRAAPAEHGYGE